LDREESADALVDARRRNVGVQVVMDKDISTRQSRRLKRIFNRDNTVIDPLTGEPKSYTAPNRGGDPTWSPGRDNSFVVQCDGSCRGDKTQKNLHTKFYAFSETGTAKNVVMVSSANLNKGGARLGWNDMFTVVQEPEMYDKYAQIHAEMSRDKADGDTYVVQQVGPYESRFFPLQRPSKSTDPTYQALSNVKCRGVTDGAGRNGRTLINVSMFWWARTRGIYLARRLIELDGQGCDVRIIYGAPGVTVSDLLRESARSGGVELWDSRFDRNRDGKVDLRVHHKYLLINGNYAGDTSSWQVFTGSQNWSGGSLAGGDELTFQISRRGAYGDYLQNWNYVREHGIRRRVDN
ncbi:MAG: phospholipase D-like domain-containing protein, partial [Actinomycetota bacterium]|nr:phospholipase D-like domain-containing protein [Actinomycetota bacterium]